MDLSKRFRCEALRERVMSAEEAALLIRDGETVAVSGFTPSGCPKAVPLALAQQVRDGERKLRLGLFSGASTGEELDSAWAEQDMVARRLPYMTSKALRAAVNGGSEAGAAYTDLHLGMVAQNARYGFYGPIRTAIIEAAAITEEGHLIPTTALGCSQTWIDLAQQVIVELNLRQPAELEGFHDVYRVADPPIRQPIPLTDAAQRIGVPYIACDVEKVAAVVYTNTPDIPHAMAPITDDERVMAGYIVDFLKAEQAKGRLPENLLPLQSGVGSVSNAVKASIRFCPKHSRQSAKHRCARSACAISTCSSSAAWRSTTATSPK